MPVRELVECAGHAAAWAVVSGEGINGTNRKETCGLRVPVVDHGGASRQQCRPSAEYGVPQPGIVHILQAGEGFHQRCPQMLPNTPRNIREKEDSMLPTSTQ